MTVNQTMFVDNLRGRMYYSFNSKFYLESIVCSYAIIEDRTKRICEHLGISSSTKMTLDKKTEYIYNAIKNKSLETDYKKKKIIGFLENRIKGTKLLNIDLSKEYKEVCSIVDKMSLENQLISFRKQRNDFTHLMMCEYDNTNPRLIDFEDFADLASKGIDIAKQLCSIASAMKRKKLKL